MSYKLQFLPPALKEWNKLEASLRTQFKLKLDKRLKNPEVAKDRLRGNKDSYKIKLRNSGYRLVYEVEQKTVTVYVIAVGKRDGSTVYRKAVKRKRYE